MIVPPSTRRALVACAIGALVGLCSARAETRSGEPADEAERASRGIRAWGSLAWVFDDDLDLVGDLAADLPWAVDDHTAIHLSIWTRTAITGSVADLAFEVGELDYSVSLGARREMRSGRRLWWFVGQDGKALVDDDGSSFARYAAAGVESAVRRGDGLYWFGALGPVFDDRGVSADAWLSGQLQWDRPDRKGRPLRRLGVDVAIRGLFDGGDLEADVEIGPHYLVDFGEAHRLTLFAHYLDGDSPLGLGIDGVLVGFDYSQEPGGHGARLDPPVVQGRVAAGAGQGRTAARLELDLEYPAFPFGGWVTTDFDVNALSGDDADELYYFYRVGYEHPVVDGLVAGAYFYHRSNHQISLANASVTSINVADVGASTATWRGPLRGLSRGAWGRFDWIAHVGYLVKSSFGEEQRWWLYGGGRWLLPVGRRFVPLIEAEIEEGDVGRYDVAIGVAGAWGTVLEVKYLDDDQFFGEDSSAFLFVAERRF